MPDTKKPLIGITSRYINMRIGESLGTHKLCLNNDYIDSITEAGGIPLILPIVLNETAIQAYASVVDGLLLTGGEDITPQLYGEEPSTKLTATAPDRDYFELGLIKAVLAQKKPILGICRGLQIINVSLGGTLHQDIASEFANTCVLHRQQSLEHVGCHSVKLSEGSILQRIFDVDSLITNSFHHQSIKTLGSGLTPTAQTSDGIIEGVEMPQEKFIIGVQWHPECMLKSDPNTIKLFKSFIQAASKEEF
ncbi:MAG TPA: gamma-glutamyl-gamma-aminobutyrate hydrolase family protein [Parachlamydiaceae bacterium]|nr:gamma-glutamyl-gamma-aminobutyrate hydrolase family protein [Parachlamydiaceae bacterium]